jgi:serine/threonine protein kinase
MKRQQSTTNDTCSPAELKRNDVMVLDALGNGQFGVVHRGQLTVLSGHARTQIPVAIKMAQDGGSSQAQKAFSEEAVMTWMFRHDNVVGMFGVVTTGFPHLLVLELCPNGSLLS